MKLLWILAAVPYLFPPFKNLNHTASNKKQKIEQILQKLAVELQKQKNIQTTMELMCNEHTHDDIYLAPCNMTPCHLCIGAQLEEHYQDEGHQNKVKMTCKYTLETC